MTSARPVDLARLALGVVIVARPDVPLRLTGGRTLPHERAAVRVLGARYLVQSAVGLARGRSRWVRRGDVAVEVVHAATMLGLAGASPRHRRLALASAGAALALATVDLRGAAW